MSLAADTLQFPTLWLVFLSVTAEFTTVPRPMPEEDTFVIWSLLARDKLPAGEVAVNPTM